MKRILQFLCLFFLCLSAYATGTNIVVLTVTITNVPSAGDTFVPNGVTRTWRVSPTVPSTEITIGADIGASATNLFRQLAGYQLAGPVSLGFSSSNVITIRGAIGEAMAATTSGTWATVDSSTYNVYPMNAVRVPAANEPTQSTATNILSQLVSDLSKYSTNAISAGTTIAQNLVQTTGDQTIAGNKTFSGNSVISGQWTISNTSPFFQSYDSDGPLDQKYTVIGMTSLGFAVSFYNDTLTTPSVAFYVARSGGVPTSVTFISPIIATTLQGTLTGSGVTNCALTNVVFYQTNYSTGIFGHTRANNTSLANGNNAGIDFGTKVYVKIKAGPTGAFTINGIAGGADGRILILDNSIAQNMTIANDSGVEPTSANRIYTRTGADVTTTGQGVVTLIYDSEDSHWVLVNSQL